MIHLDVSALSRTPEGTPVPEWPGVSGTQHRAATVIGASEPTLHVDRSSRNRMVQFDGETTLLSVRNHADLPFGVNGFTVILVFQSASRPVDDQTMLTMHGGSDECPSYTFSVQGQRLVGSRSDDATSSSVTVPLDPINQTQIVTLAIERSPRNLSDAIGGIDCPNDLVIGGYRLGQQMWSGNVGEITIYRRLLAPREQQRIRQHLSLKWAAWPVG